MKKIILSTSFVLFIISNTSFAGFCSKFSGVGNESKCKLHLSKCSWTPSTSGHGGSCTDKVSSSSHGKSKKSDSSKPATGSNPAEKPKSAKSKLPKNCHCVSNDYDIAKGVFLKTGEVDESGKCADGLIRVNFDASLMHCDPQKLNDSQMNSCFEGLKKRGC